MKPLIITATLLFISVFAYSQDTVSRENQLSLSIHENYHVLKSNKKIRHGLYIAVYKKSTVMAKGEYNNGKRTGQWQFFGANGNPTQIYNYDTRQFALIDAGSKKGYPCTFEQTPAATDTIERPIAIGGFIYAVAPLVVRRDIDEKVRPFNLEDGKMLNINHVLTINEEGVVLRHVAYTEIDGKKNSYDIDDRDYNDGSPRFVPASVNHKPVACLVTFRTGLTISSTSIRRITTTNGTGRPNANDF